MDERTKTGHRGPFLSNPFEDLHDERSGANAARMDPARGKDTRASAPSSAEPGELRGETFAPPREALDDQAWYAKLVADGVAPLIAEAHVTHRRDLPMLLEKHPGKWAAYRGGERLSIGSSQVALYKKYREQGSGRGEFIVFEIAPDVFQEEFEFPLPS